MKSKGLKFQAGLSDANEFRGAVIFMKDENGDYVITLGHSSKILPEINSKSIRIRRATNQTSALTHNAIEVLVNHIHDMHRKDPKNPMYIVDEDWNIKRKL